MRTVRKSQVTSTLSLTEKNAYADVISSNIYANQEGLTPYFIKHESMKEYIDLSSSRKTQENQTDCRSRTWMIYVEWL